MKMYYCFFIFMILLVSFCKKDTSNNGDAESVSPSNNVISVNDDIRIKDLDTFRDEISLRNWKYGIDYLIEKQGAQRVKDEQIRKELILLGERINKSIEEEDMDYLVSIFGEEIIWFGYPKIYQRKKIDRVKFIQSLQSKSGDYYDGLFDKIKWLTRLGANTEGWDKVDLKSYIKNHKQFFEWEVLYYSKENEYEMWFPIIVEIYETMGPIHYRVKKIDGDWKLIGSFPILEVDKEDITQSESPEDLIAPFNQ